jgi:hypothetical protein
MHLLLVEDMDVPGFGFRALRGDTATPDVIVFLCNGDVAGGLDRNHL